jgi:hypothetical protein
MRRNALSLHHTYKYTYIYRESEYSEYPPLAVAGQCGQFDYSKNPNFAERHKKF